MSKNKKQKFTFEIQHGMRQEKVAAIVEIGLIIDQLNKNKE